jgi:hypothetical protein
MVDPDGNATGGTPSQHTSLRYRLFQSSTLS